MTGRALLSIAIVAAISGPVAADKQKVAVLGLEVTGSIDYESTNIAKNLTDELRKQVRASAKLAIAPASNKELIDEKVAHSCDSEATDCMSKIARKLAADHLMYGKIFKKKKDGAEGYQLELKLLDVDKQSKRPASIWIPLAETIGSDIGRAASRAYKEVVVEDEDGTPLPDPVVRPRSERGDSTWKKIAIASGVVTIAATGVHVYAWQQLEKTKGSDGVRGSACLKIDGVYEDGPLRGACEAGDRNKAFTYTFGPLAIGAGVFTAIATYKGFIAKRDSGERATASGKRQRKREGFVVTPVVSPNGAGATVRFDW